MNRKYYSETTAVLRLKGQQNAAVSEPEEGRWRDGESKSETVREKHDLTYISLREHIQWNFIKIKTLVTEFGQHLNTGKDQNKR